MRNTRHKPNNLWVMSCIVGSICQSVEETAYLSVRYGKTLPVISWWLESYGIQAKVEIIEFMSCIPVVFDTAATRVSQLGGR